MIFLLYCKICRQQNIYYKTKTNKFWLLRKKTNCKKSITIYLFARSIKYTSNVCIIFFKLRFYTAKKSWKSEIAWFFSFTHHFMRITFAVNRQWGETTELNNIESWFAAGLNWQMGVSSWESANSYLVSDIAMTDKIL